MKHQAHQEHEEAGAVLRHESLDELGREIVDCGFQVHKHICPGLLESAYEVFLCEELSGRGLGVKMQQPLKVHYKNRAVDMAYRLDLVVEDKVLIELKSVEKFLPIHEAQILTYLRLSELRLGFLMNFNTKLFKDGIRRYVM